MEHGFAEIWRAIAAAQPGEVAVVQGDRHLTWREFDAQAAALARHWRRAGLRAGARVTAAMRNMAEYPVVFFAAYRLGLTSFTCNYRYTGSELAYLFADAGAEAVVFSTETLETMAAARAASPGVRSWIALPNGGPAPAWATDFAAAIADDGPEPPLLARPDEDLLLLYTGGTTGMPKGVVWRHADLIAAIGQGAAPDLGLPPCETLDELVGRLPIPGFRPRILVGGPLMHGAGQSAMFAALAMGGRLLLLDKPRFDPEELWDLAEREEATRIAFVGDAFARPLLDRLDAQPGRWRLPELKTITSTGAMWSAETKHGLLRHLPHVRMVDTLASSEGPPLGDSITTASDGNVTGRFVMRPHCAVFTEDGVRVAPGSGVVGRLAIGGRLPLGYLGDPAKTAATYRELEGERWAIAGDMATVDADGAIRLLGRGSQCINTGGEKVFPEEVEEALKRLPEVRDAIVVGLPDARFGERVVALVEPVAAAPKPEPLRDRLRAELAGYKVPRLLVFGPVPRLVNGKPDLKRTREALLAAGVTP